MKPNHWRAILGLSPRFWRPQRPAVGRPWHFWFRHATCYTTWSSCPAPWQAKDGKGWQWHGFSGKMLKPFKHPKIIFRSKQSKREVAMDHSLSTFVFNNRIRQELCHLLPDFHMGLFSQEMVLVWSPSLPPGSWHSRFMMSFETSPNTCPSPSQWWWVAWTGSRRPRSCPRGSTFWWQHLDGFWITCRIPRDLSITTWWIWPSTRQIVFWKWALKRRLGVVESMILYFATGWCTMWELVQASTVSLLQWFGGLRLRRLETCWNLRHNRITEHTCRHPVVQEGKAVISWIILDPPWVATPRRWTWSSNSCPKSDKPHCSQPPKLERWPTWPACHWTNPFLWRWRQRTTSRQWLAWRRDMWFARRKAGFCSCSLSWRGTRTRKSWCSCLLAMQSSVLAAHWVVWSFHKFPQMVVVYYYFYWVHCWVYTTLHQWFSSIHMNCWGSMMSCWTTLMFRWTAFMATKSSRPELPRAVLAEVSDCCCGFTLRFHCEGMGQNGDNGA